MRVLAPLVILVILVAIAWFVVRAADTLPRRPQRRSMEPACWRVAHTSREGTTQVLVRREDPVSGEVLDEREVGSVPDADPDFDAKLMEALATAHSRAALFNTEET